MSTVRAARAFVAAGLWAVAAAPASAGLILFGDKDTVGFGPYATEPTAGATQLGLAAGVVTFGSSSYHHAYPFAPSTDDFAGTDQIHTAANQSATYDGYSQYGGRVQGPVTFDLDYASLVAPGEAVATLTLGIMADDFQQPTCRQPFRVLVNGVVNTGLTDAINGLDETGPYARFITVGIDPATLAADHHLTVKIEELGDGRDGWAVDFLTVGVTTTLVPEPAAALCAAPAAAAFLTGRRRSRR